MMLSTWTVPIMLCFSLAHAQQGSPAIFNNVSPQRFHLDHVPQLVSTGQSKFKLSYINILPRAYNNSPILVNAADILQGDFNINYVDPAAQQKKDEARQGDVSFVSIDGAEGTPQEFSTDGIVYLEERQDKNQGISIRRQDPRGKFVVPPSGRRDALTNDPFSHVPDQYKPPNMPGIAVKNTENVSVERFNPAAAALAKSGTGPSAFPGNQFNQLFASQQQSVGHGPPQNLIAPPQGIAQGGILPDPAIAQYIGQQFGGAEQYAPASQSPHSGQFGPQPQPQYTGQSQFTGQNQQSVSQFTDQNIAPTLFRGQVAGTTNQVVGVDPGWHPSGTNAEFWKQLRSPYLQPWLQQPQSVEPNPQPFRGTPNTIPWVPQVSTGGQVPRFPQIPSGSQSPNFPQIRSDSQVPNFSQIPSGSQLPNLQQISSGSQVPNFQQIPSGVQIPKFPQIPSGSQVENFPQGTPWQHQNFQRQFGNAIRHAAPSVRAELFPEKESHGQMVPSDPNNPFRPRISPETRIDSDAAFQASQFAAEQRMLIDSDAAFLASQFAVEQRMSANGKPSNNQRKKQREPKTNTIVLLPIEEVPSYVDTQVRKHKSNVSTKDS